MCARGVCEEDAAAGLGGTMCAGEKILAVCVPGSQYFTREVSAREVYVREGEAKGVMNSREQGVVY